VRLRRSCRWIAIAATAAAAACSAASSAVEGTATAAAAGVTATVDAGANVVSAILPLTGPSGFDAQRAQMEERAGPAHFRNDGLTAGKEAMVARRATFVAQREQFVSPQFQEARAKLRSGSTRPNRGPVLGAAASAASQDPDLARALIGAAAASQGVPIVPVQPILAELLPAFGH
jgi:hypothetical protein